MYYVYTDILCQVLFSQGSPGPQGPQGSSGPSGVRVCGRYILIIKLEYLYYRVNKVHKELRANRAPLVVRGQLDHLVTLDDQDYLVNK